MRLRLNSNGQDPASIRPVKEDNFGDMVRTSLTLATVVLLTAVLGMAAMTVGLVLPRRWCFEYLYQGWALGITAAAGIRLTVEGADHLQDGVNYFFVGNHQSAMDIPIMIIVAGGRIRFLAKRSLFHIPIFGWVMRLHGFVPIDRTKARKAKNSIDKMLESTSRRPVSMLVFPEGTRADDESIRPFKHGAMKVCQRAGMAVVPFAVAGALRVHRRRVLRIRPGRLHVSIAQPIPFEEVAECRTDQLARRVREAVVRMYEDGCRKLSAPTGSAVAAVRGGW